MLSTYYQVIQQVSEELIKSNIVKKISITGSTRVGKLILKQAEKVQRVTWSCDFSIHVSDDVDLNKVTDMAITANFRIITMYITNRFYMYIKKMNL